MRYLLDANTYIQAKNFHYGMAFCPAYWQWLDAQFELGIVGSIDMIGRELKNGDDELADWAKSHLAHFINNDDHDTQNIFSQIVVHVMAADYNPGNRDDFLAGADPWIIAKAKSIGATVVTHEKLVGLNSTKVKIPNICQAFGVPYLSTFELLQELKAQFVLAC